MAAAPETELSKFAQDLFQEVVSEASLDDQEMMLSGAFTSLLLTTLNETGDWPEGHLCYHRQYGMEISGWGWDSATGTLDICVTAFAGTGEVDRLSPADARSSLKRLTGFFEAALKGLHGDLEPASPQFDLAYLVNTQAEKGKIHKVRLFLLTDQLTSLEIKRDKKVAGVPCSSHIWDLERIHRLYSSGQERERIEIDLVERFGEGLPCLQAPSLDPELSSYLFVVPGQVLADLYNEFGAQLLELNVRSFLQARGKVNRGIRDTILGQPERFFSYNNGISAAAGEVTIEPNSQGQLAITKVKDLQIVNGGQTTASLAAVVRNDNADVSNVAVQAKLTVVPSERIPELVPLISRFANSQNRVSEADLSANHPFHVRMEQLSRTIWAPAPEGGTRETRWFYERARGQYNDAQANLTPAKKKKFRAEHPTPQKFSKTDLTKFENMFAMKPHIVSKGAQKSFVEFMLTLEDKPDFLPDQTYFEQLCAKALLWKSAERIVSRQDFGGYRANIVAYTLGVVVDSTKSKLNLSQIWKRQVIGEATAKAIELISHDVYKYLINPPGGKNVTEWAKAEACWKGLKDQDLEVPDLSEDSGSGGGRTSGVDVSSDPAELVDWCVTIPSEDWFGIAQWAKREDHLQPWQRGISFSIGKIVERGGEPSLKQAVQARRLFDDALAAGYESGAS